MKRLEPKEELERLKSIYGSGSVPKLYSQLRDGFATLQSRSHVLLNKLRWQYRRLYAWNRVGFCWVRNCCE